MLFYLFSNNKQPHQNNYYYDIYIFLNLQRLHENLKSKDNFCLYQILDKPYTNVYKIQNYYDTFFVIYEK